MSYELKKRMLLIRSYDKILQCHKPNSIFQKERFLTFDLKSKLMMHVLIFFYVFYMFSKLQMGASHASVSRKKQLSEKEIAYKQQSLIAYKKCINSLEAENESICVLEAKKSNKEEELKNCYWNQCMATKKFLLSVDLN